MLRWITGKTRNDRVRNQVIQEDAKVCQMPISLRQKIFKLVWTYQEKRRRQHLKKNDGHGCTGGEKKGTAYTEMARHHPGGYEQILNDKWHEWKQIGPSIEKLWWIMAQKDVEMVSKGKKERWECILPVKFPSTFVTRYRHGRSTCPRNLGCLGETDRSRNVQSSSKTKAAIQDNMEFSIIDILSSAYTSHIILGSLFSATFTAGLRGCACVRACMSCVSVHRSLVKARQGAGQS